MAPPCFFKLSCCSSVGESKSGAEDEVGYESQKGQRSLQEAQKITSCVEEVVVMVSLHSHHYCGSTMDHSWPLTGLFISLMFLVKASRRFLWCHYMRILQPIQECLQGLKLGGASAGLWDQVIVKYLIRHRVWPSPKSMPCITSVAVRFVTSRIEMQETHLLIGMSGRARARNHQHGFSWNASAS